MLKIILNSSLEKIFKDRAPMNSESGGTVFKNEICRFQVAFFSDSDLKDVSLEVHNEAFDVLSYYVREHKADKENYDCSDDYFDKSSDQMYPEILMHNAPRVCAGGIWHAFFLCVKCKAGIQANTIYPLKLSLLSQGDKIGNAEYNIEILDDVLPDMDIPITCWMHYDCIADRHNVKLFEQNFYEIFEKYLDLYVGSGHNMLLIPTFTPVVDTAVGGERLTAQLVDVEKNGEIYSFCFDRLDKFIDFIRARGIKYFEFSHLFTQWGAKACPKIIAKNKNGYERIFGWDTPSDSAKYLNFLSQYLPKLTDYVTQKGIAEQSFYHLSDEPLAQDLERYEMLYHYVKKFSGKIRTIDALSDIDFFRRHIVDLAAVASDHVTPFLNANAPYIVYYCCCQHVKNLSNRFFSMPSERTAVIGVQMYQNNAAGFLQWGFNFYNTQFSLQAIDPYLVTGSGGYTDSNSGFPSGDAFMIYPDGDNVIPSIRLEVFNDGLQLYLALKKLEAHIGREKTLAMLREHGYLDGYETYPHSSQSLKILRQDIYNAFRSKKDGI